jgi:hypothetical protein
VVVVVAMEVVTLTATVRIATPEVDRLCGLVVTVPGYRSISPVSIPGATRLSEKQ